MSTEDPIGKIW